MSSSEHTRFAIGHVFFFISNKFVIINTLNELSLST